MSVVMDGEYSWTPDKMVEVLLSEPDDFLKVRETLTYVIRFLKGILVASLNKSTESSIISVMPNHRVDSSLSAAKFNCSL